MGDKSCFTELFIRPGVSDEFFFVSIIEAKCRFNGGNQALPQEIAFDNAVLFLARVFYPT